MNKCDLLEKKLKAGIKVNRYMTSYADRENDLATFSACKFAVCGISPFVPLNTLVSDLLHKFKDVMDAASPERRTFYGFMTSVVVSI